MKHEDTFNRGVTLILGQLLEDFPIEHRMFDLTKLEPALDEATLEVHWGTMDFLINEGFVRGRQIASNAPLYGNVNLTLKALELLRAMPASLQGKQSWGERMIAAGKAGTRETASIVAREFMRFAVEQAGLRLSQG